MDVCLLILFLQGGSSFASTSSEQGARSGGRWLLHPHVLEIEKHAQVAVNSFVPIVTIFL